MHTHFQIGHAAGRVAGGVAVDIAAVHFDPLASETNIVAGGFGEGVVGADCETAAAVDAA